MMPKILLVDDNEDSRVIYGTLFEAHGYEVCWAGDGPGGIATCREEHPDVLVLNLFLPGMNGHDVLKELRKDPATASVRCLMLTGDARPEQMGEALIRGADAFMTKPVEPRAVLEMVEGIIEGDPPRL